MYVLKCVGYANGTPCPYDNQYLKWYNPNLLYGELGAWTTDQNLALKLPNVIEALGIWRMRRIVDGWTRPDGKPNRPLTAFNIEILEV